MSRSDVLEASGVALGLLVAWWGGILSLDGLLAETFPYHTYETLSYLYPDVFYPALPGWILAHAQPYSVGVWLVALGWMVAVAVAIGAGATKYADSRDQSPTVIAGVSIVVLFVAVTGIEAAVTLLR